MLIALPLYCAVGERSEVLAEYSAILEQSDPEEAKRLVIGKACCSARDVPPTPVKSVPC